MLNEFQEFECLKTPSIVGADGHRSQNVLES